MLLQWTVAILALASQRAGASSTRPQPLHPRALSHPSDLAVYIIPRSDITSSTTLSATHRRQSDPSHPLHDDRFLLSFRLSSDDRPVLLSLRPSTTLIHPDGIKSVHTHTDETGVRTTDTRWMPRDEVRAYEGWVVEEGEDLDRWIREEEAGVHRSASGSNWARIVLPPPGADEGDGDGGLRFQGSFSRGDELYTIHPTENYLRTREALDPDPPMLRKRSLGGWTETRPSMVVVREHDTLTPAEQVALLRRRGLALPDWPTDDESSEALSAAANPISCGHDHLSFNVDPSHPVYAAAYEQAAADQLALGMSPWLTTVFGMPSRSAPPPSFVVGDYSRSGTKACGYPPKVKLGKRQGDINGGSNTSSNFINSIGSTVGCPKEQRLLFMGVAADCTYVSTYGSASAARTQILTDFNSATALYASSFNVSLGIVELNVQSGACPTSAAGVDAANPWNLPCQEFGALGVDLNDRLSVFSQWRGKKGGSDGAGLWSLLTNCSTGSEVGVAWLGQLCNVAAATNAGQTTSGTSVTSVTRSEWQVVAHEIGHNFGAIHDCATGCSITGPCCPLTKSTCDASANFIMSPVSSKNVSAFSQCSIGNVCSSLSSSLNTTCLGTPGASGNPALISLKSCGNGIVEAGEDCDPGQNVADPCCNATTCKFTSGSVCDPTNSACCTSTCQLAPANRVCRASVDAQCDHAEICTGTSATCPADSFVSDGTSCGSNGLACASGVCTSRSQQCQTAGSSLGLTSACPAQSVSSTTTERQEARRRVCGVGTAQPLPDGGELRAG